MSSQQPNAWQTAGRPASRTPQSRSGTGSPSQQAQPSQPPRADSGRPSQQQPNNVWAMRSSSGSRSNGQTNAEVQPPQDDSHEPVNGFNTGAVKAFLGRDAAAAGAVVYKPAEVAGSNRSSGGAWGAKSNSMATGQPFFTQLAKSVATAEGGG